MKPARATVSLLALLVASACASSQAEPNRPAATPPAPVASPSYDGTDQPVSRAVPGWPEAPPNYSPYGVELLSGDFRSLPTFYSSGRAYVMGSIGERYRIRITNPTARRVEAIVSVDGLDAIDGKTASYEDKRGYVILPYGDVTIEGFRTSLNQVATFRFSPVRDSYAGRKGQDRNVRCDRRGLLPRSASGRFACLRGPSSPTIANVARPNRLLRPRHRLTAVTTEAAHPPTPARPLHPPPTRRAKARVATLRAPRPSPRRIAPDSAPSSASKGTRASTTRPSSAKMPRTPARIVELRYNDREGLLALGIPVDRFAPSDVSLRETADPFPRNRFATPPPR